MTKAFPTSPGACLDITANIDPLAIHIKILHALEFPKFSLSHCHFGRATVNFNGQYPGEPELFPEHF